MVPETERGTEMSNVTDTERREVAAWLRRFSDRHPSGIFDGLVLKHLGVEYDDEDFCGGICTSESIKRLADLIDPTCFACEAESIDGFMSFPQSFCSECGGQLPLDCKDGRIALRYPCCPHCGSHVIKEES